MAEQVLNLDFSDVTEAVEQAAKLEETIDRTGTSIQDLTSEYKQAKAQIRKMEDALNDARTSLANMSEQTKGFDELQERTEQLEEDLEAARSEMSRVEEETRTAADGTRRIGSNVDIASDQMRDMARNGQLLANEIKTVSRNSRKYANSNADARQSAMAVGNILSDLPHGMMAISNNVGELVEGFQGIETSGRSMMGIMKSMVGPALLGGLLTGVFTLASRWDKVSAKIKDAWMFLQGVSETQRKLMEQVRKQEKKLPERIAGGLSEEGAKDAKARAQDLLRQIETVQSAVSKLPGDVGLLLARREAGQEQRTEIGRGELSKAEKGVIANMPAEQMRALANADPETIQDLRDIIKQINKEYVAAERASNNVLSNVRKLGSAGQGLSNTFSDALEEDEEDQSDKVEKRRKMRQNLERMRLKITRQGVQKRIALKRNEIQQEANAEIKKAKKLFGPDSEQLRLVKMFYDRKQQIAKSQIQAEVEMARIAERKKNEMAIIQASRRQSQRHMANNLPVPGRGIGSGVTKAQNNIARQKSKFGFRMSKSKARASAVRSKMASLSMQMFGQPGGPTNEQARQMQAFNRKYEKILSKRQLARAKHNRKMKRLRQNEQQAQFKAQQRKLGAVSSMTSNLEKAFGSITGMIRSNVQQRIREYKREGMTQEKARKKATKEARARFNTMKKIQIAASVANTIAAGVKNFQGTIQKMGGGPLAYGVAITQMAATLASGYAQVRKLRQTKIGGGVPGKGTGGQSGGLSSSFSQLNTRQRNNRVRNFVQETATDQIRGTRDSDAAKAIREEEAKTREKLDESRAIGDEESFDSNQRAQEYRNKAVS